MKLDYKNLGKSTHTLFKKLAKDIFLSVGTESAQKTTAGIKNKDVPIQFKDGQTVTLGVKDTGDVYQVKINGRLVAIKEQDDDKKAIAEISAMLEKSRAAFQKAQAKQKVKLPAGIKTAAPTMKATLQARVVQLDEQIQSAKQALGLA